MNNCTEVADGNSAPPEDEDIASLYEWANLKDARYHHFPRSPTQLGDYILQTHRTRIEASTESTRSRNLLAGLRFPAMIWRDIGAGRNIGSRFLRLAFLLAAVAIFCLIVGLPLTWPQGALPGLLILVLAVALARSSNSSLITLTLMTLSIFCTARYGYWRITQVIHLFEYPYGLRHVFVSFFIVALLAAEIYGFLVLCLGYFQTIWPLHRDPQQLPENHEEWPHVDVLIPTYNEPLDVVRQTVFGALNMDWPRDKIHIYILDDGRRAEFRQFAALAGVGYKARPDNQHAKAGNINAALKDIRSPLVAIFDCDHVPTRSFLQVTTGWFLRDRKLAILQTPHHFYSPDPFERNLKQFHVVPNENDLFYGVIQDCNDFWNATFFCGSCAVIRREALDEIGGIAVETVTEDAHTSLRIQKNGWNTAYINIPQAAGLATETLSAHIGQRIRWARGMVQILRTDNPFLSRRLSFPQRLCYFAAMGHYLYAIPRLIFLTAPLVYLISDNSVIPGYSVAILAYAIPHLVLLTMTNLRIQGKHRHSFWNEIYETVLSPYILLPTMMALINPKLGKFNVTSKGGIVKRTYFDTKVALPFLILLYLNLAGLLVSIPRMLFWDRVHTGTLAINVIWCSVNIMVLGVCTAVSREERQVRNTVRINVALPLQVKMPDGRSIAGETIDISNGGASIRLSADANLVDKDKLELVFPSPATGIDLPAVVVSKDGSLLRVQFIDLTIPEQKELTMVMYSRANAWLSSSEAQEGDSVLHSAGRILKTSMRGLVLAFQRPSVGIMPAEPSRVVATTSSILLVVAFLAGSAKAMVPTQAQQLHLGTRVYTIARLFRPSTFMGLVRTIPQIQLLREGTARYCSVALRWHGRVARQFMNQPWIAAAVLLAMCFLVAVWIKEWVLRRAAQRLGCPGE